MDKEKNKTIDQGNGEDLMTICPFVKKRYDKCYCVDMDSRKTSLAIRYCMGNFEQCEIYKKLLKERGFNHRESSPILVAI